MPTDATPPGPSPAAHALPRGARACGTCSLCCKVMEVTELAKPKGRWCAHVAPGHGCGIYDRRPGPCRTFFCAYLTRSDIAESWRPETCGIVLVEEDGGRRLVAHVDTDAPDGWRREPYQADLRRWARDGVSVAVYVGKRVIVVHPAGETDLGVVGDDEMIVTRDEATPFGRRYRAFKMRKPAA